MLDALRHWLMALRSITADSFVETVEKPYHVVVEAEFNHPVLVPVLVYLTLKQACKFPVVGLVALLERQLDGLGFYTLDGIAQLRIMGSSIRKLRQFHGDIRVACSSLFYREITKGLGSYVIRDNIAQDGFLGMLDNL